MTAVHPRHWSSVPGGSPSIVQIPPPVDPAAYSSRATSPVRSPSSQAVRHVPHSPSFRQLPMTVPSYAFKQTPTAAAAAAAAATAATAAANSTPGPEPSPPPPPPPPANRPSLSSSHSAPPASNSSDLPSQRYRRGHRRSEVYMSSAQGTVVQPPPLTRSWSSPALTAFPGGEPTPSIKPVNYQQQPSQACPPELYYQSHRRSSAPVYGRPQSPVRQSQSRLELHHSSRSSSSSSVSSVSVEPPLPSRFNGPTQMTHSRKASVASSDSRHARHSSIDSVSTSSSSNGRGTPQPDYSERRSRLRMQSAVPMDRSGSEVLLAATNATKTPVVVGPASVASNPQRVVPKQDKKISRIKKALSFIAPASTSSTTANVTQAEQEIECNFSNNSSIYENRRNKGDDNMSIRSTASSVSKALKRMPWFTGSKPTGTKSDSSSVFLDDVESVGEIFDIDNNDSAEQDDDSVKKFEPSKKVDFIPKSILKNAGSGQIEIASEESLPILTRESSLVSHSSSSSSSLKAAGKPSSATGSHRPTLSNHSTSSVSFSPEIRIYNTWNSGEYDRKIPDAVPFSTYPLWMIAQIKEEINTYKMMEMEIHELSRSNTCLY
ncbi:hypothetical protein V1509DRAFT_619778 [Lipomyces kononenkoae]